MKWFRVYSEIKDDPKMLELDDHQRWLWVCLMALASESRERGVILDVRVRGLAAALRTDPDRLQAALDLMTELGMIEYDEAGQSIALSHWNDRQYDKPSDMPNATRDRKRRSRQCHANVTPSHALDTDTDTDTESETENTTTTRVSAPAPDGGGGGVLDPAFAEVCSTYEQNIGLLTKIIADQLEDDMQTYGAQWVIDAIGIAVKAEKRSLAYAEGVLDRWKREGRNSKKRGGTNGAGRRNTLQVLKDQETRQTWNPTDEELAAARAEFYASPTGAELDARRREAVPKVQG